MAFENLKSTGIKYLLTKLKDYFLQIKDAVKSVNGELPDETGDITLNTVPYAQNLESESSHRNYDTFIVRTTGGDSSVMDGDAWLMVLRGNNEHDGFVPESLEMTVTSDTITAEIDRDTFVLVVATSGTTTLTFTSAWSEDPTTYGITVTGTPTNGDTIVVNYVKEVRGTITVANPQTFVCTGWNLYDHASGFARVAKYEFGYKISGTYTSIKYSATQTGTQTDVVVNDGNFDIPADGYIHVTGGNSTDTAIYPTWEDWTDGYDGSFEAYTESVVDLSTVMGENFPYGLMKAGSVVDELDLNLGQAISRVQRLAYSSENIATAKASGREYEYDENYIYLARESAATVSVTVDGSFTSSDHSIEFFTGTNCDVYAELLYGNNLRNKLERDVLTISSQTLTAEQKSQVQTNIGISVKNNLTTTAAGSILDARQGKALKDLIDVKAEIVTLASVSANGNKTYTLSNTARILLVALGASTSKNAWLVNCASGTVSVMALVASGSVISAESTAANKLKLTNTGANGAGVYAIVMQGTIE